MANKLKQELMKLLESFADDPDEDSAAKASFNHNAADLEDITPEELYNSFPSAKEFFKEKVDPVAPNNDWFKEKIADALPDVEAIRAKKKEVEKQKSFHDLAASKGVTFGEAIDIYYYKTKEGIKEQLTASDNFVDALVDILSYHFVPKEVSVPEKETASLDLLLNLDQDAEVISNNITHALIDAINPSEGGADRAKNFEAKTAEQKFEKLMALKNSITEPVEEEKELTAEDLKNIRTKLAIHADMIRNDVSHVLIDTGISPSEEGAEMVNRIDEQMRRAARRQDVIEEVTEALRVKKQSDVLKAVVHDSESDHTQALAAAKQSLKDRKTIDQMMEKLTKACAIAQELMENPVNPTPSQVNIAGATLESIERLKASLESRKTIFDFESQDRPYEKDDKQVKKYLAELESFKNTIDLNVQGFLQEQIKEAQKTKEVEATPALDWNDPILNQKLTAENLDVLETLDENPPREVDLMNREGSSDLEDDLVNLKKATEKLKEFAQMKLEQEEELSKFREKHPVQMPRLEDVKNATFTRIELKPEEKEELQKIREDRRRALGEALANSMKTGDPISYSVLKPNSYQEMGKKLIQEESELQPKATK